jgi:hypothetical protein
MASTGPSDVVISSDGSTFSRRVTNVDPTTGTPVGTGLTNTELRASAVTVDTELAAAAALGDAIANPTVTSVGGYLLVWDGTSAWRRLAAFAQSSDAVSSGRFGVGVQAFGHRYNGTSFDRERGNVDGTAYASAARTATPTPMTDAVNYNGKGLWVVIDVTSVTSTPSVTFTIQGKDPVSGKYVDLLTSAAIATVSTVSLQIHPGLTAAANTVANGILPRVWRIIATHGNSNSITYSVGYSMIA